MGIRDEQLGRRVPPASGTRIDALARSARFPARDVGATAMVTRELDVPMISHASVPNSVANGTAVSVAVERGVVYADPVGVET